MSINVGDVIKYGAHDWQWGLVIELDLGVNEVRVLRRNRKWVRRDRIEVVIPKRAWQALLGDVRQGERFVEGFNQYLTAIGADGVA